MPPIFRPETQAQSSTSYPTPYSLSPFLDHLNLENPISNSDLRQQLYNSWDIYYKHELRQIENTLREATYCWIAHLCTNHTLHIDTSYLQQSATSLPFRTPTKQISIPNLDPSISVLIPGSTACERCTTLHTYIKAIKATHQQVSAFRQEILLSLQPTSSTSTPPSFEQDLEYLFQELINSDSPSHDHQENRGSSSTSSTTPSL